jgi:O-antigen/teichoic acid export membrane protein
MWYAVTFRLWTTARREDAVIRRRADRMSDKGAAGTGVEGGPTEPMARDRSIDREEALLDDVDVAPLARRGALWGVIAQVAQQLLSVGATMILARLLTPSDFGIITASITVLQFAQMTMALGWQAAIVRRRDADGEYLSSIFWVVTGMGAALAAITALLAPLLASLVGVPDATSYLRVLGLTCIPGAALAVPLGILQRRLQLRTMNLVYIQSFVVYVLVQVALAIAGAGAWAVIVGMVVHSSVQLVGMCLAARWRPLLVLRWKFIGQEFRFASGLLLNNGLTYGVRNADYIVVGNLMGAAALGAYYVAYVMPQILRLRFTWAAGAVMYPILVRSQSDTQRTRDVYYHTHLLLAWIGFPAMVGLAVLAQPVVQVFFGPQWSASVTPLRWLALAALLEFVTFGPGMVATAQGEVRALLRTNMVRMFLLVVGVVTAGIAFRTIGAVAAAVFVTTLIWAIYQQCTLSRRLGLAFAPLRKGLAVFAGLSIVLAGIVLVLLQQLDPRQPLVQLIGCTIAGAAVYLGLGRLLFPNITSPLLRSVIKIIRSRDSATRPGSPAPTDLGPG